GGQVVANRGLLANQLNDLGGELRVFLVGLAPDGTGDDERRPRLVDKNRVDFVDDRKDVPALHPLLQAPHHVVAQVVEPELVVRAVGDVTLVGGAALGGTRLGV